MKHQILLVNLPTERGKRAHFGLLPFQKCTNYGLLSVASHLFEKGYSVQIFDPQACTNPEYAATEFGKILNSTDWLLVGFSCISGFSYPLLNRWANLVKEICPTTYVVVGGKDHVGRIPKATLGDNPSVDAVISGEGEIPLERVLIRVKNGQKIIDDKGVHTRHASVFKSSEELAIIPSLNYSLYPNFREFPPSVEFGRGCPFACAFCVSAKSAFRSRSPSELVSEIGKVQNAYDLQRLPIYLETPIFLARTQYLQQLELELLARSIQPIWRTEARVDSLKPAQVALLYRCGMRVVDLGLESASPGILLSMQKTKKPSEYLNMASSLLRALSEQNVFAKVSILFYPGDTAESLDETLRFLRSNKNFIGAVSAYPMMLYPGMARIEDIKLTLEQAGGSLITDSAWKSRRLAPVNPSKVLSYDHLTELAHSWEQEFQTDHEYFYQRQFGYFSPRTTYTDFRASIAQVGAERFPFRIDEAQNAPTVA